jgi:hypothetical protein
LLAIITPIGPHVTSARVWPTLVLIDLLGRAVGRIAGDGYNQLLPCEIQQLFERYVDGLNPGPLPVDLKTGRLMTLIGDGKPGRGMGAATDVRMNEPGGLAITGDRIYIADANNDRILVYERAARILREQELKP